MGRITNSINACNTVVYQYTAQTLNINVCL